MQAVRPKRGFWVTGTDTGVGKTRVSAALLAAYAALGFRCVGMKPVAAGAELRDGVWQNEDVRILRATANVDAPAELVNPYLFRQPIAPHIAADNKGERIGIPRIRAAFEALSERADVLIVEGVGGFRVPLSAQHDTADLAAALGLPVILVVGLRLGCLNHALLSAEAIERRDLRLAGWVANRLEPAMPAYDANVDALRQRLQGPLLAELPHAPDARPEVAAGAFSPRRLADLLNAG